MFNISSLLQRISKNISSLEMDKKGIVDIISREVSFTISSESVEIKNNIIYTTLSPGAKNKIFMHKSSILEHIAHTTPFTITDIR